MDDNLKKLRIKSMIGLLLFIISSFLAYNYMNQVVIGGISIIGMIVGWIIFAKNHTEITKIQLKQITNDYFKDRFKKKK